MYLDSEPRFDRTDTMRSRQSRACGFEIGNEGNYLGGDLVAAPGTASARQQTSKTSRLQRVLGLVEGRPGDAELLGSIADCNAVDLVAPHHLVAHLDQVFGIEEWIAGEQVVAHGFGIGIEHAVLRQRFALRVWLFCLCHGRP